MAVKTPILCDCCRKQLTPTERAKAVAQRCKLTPGQRRVVEVVLQHEAQHGVSPTLQLIADATGVSKVTVFEHVKRLVVKGAVTNDAHQSRSLRVVEA